MRNLLCQVCGAPADQDDQGVLWLLLDHREDWPNWPEQMACTHPPVCRRCARISARICPAVRKAPLAVRVGHCPVAGVLGEQYPPGQPLPTVPTLSIVTFDDPAIHWTRAEQLIRRLSECTITDLDQV